MVKESNIQKKKDEVSNIRHGMVSQEMAVCGEVGR